MHELALTQDILDTAVRYAQQADSQKVVTIFLRVGALRDISRDWIQYYFNFIRKGTIAEEAEILVIVNPIVCRCRVCHMEFEFDRDRLYDDEIVCPGCSAKDYTLISGTEFRIEGIEII